MERIGVGRGVVLFGLLGACEPATTGLPEDPYTTLSQPSLGEDDPPTGSSSAVVWVDASGAVVEGVVDLPEGLAYVDADGYFWSLDPLGTDAQTAFGGFGVVEFAYADDNCTDPVAVGDILPPRLALYAGPDRYISMQDDGEADRPGGYWLPSGGDCNWVDDLLTRAMGADHIIELQPPTFHWVAPLHPEAP